MEKIKTEILDDDEIALETYEGVITNIKTEIADNEHTNVQADSLHCMTQLDYPLNMQDLISVEETRFQPIHINNVKKEENMDDFITTMKQEVNSRNGSPVNFVGEMPLVTHNHLLENDPVRSPWAYNQVRYAENTYIKQSPPWTEQNHANQVINHEGLVAPGSFYAPNFTAHNATMQSPHTYNLVNTNETTVQPIHWTNEHYVKQEVNSQHVHHGGSLNGKAFYAHAHKLTDSNIPLKIPWTYNRVNINESTDLAYLNGDIVWTNGNVVQKERNSSEDTIYESPCFPPKFPEEPLRSPWLHNPMNVAETSVKPFINGSRVWTGEHLIKKERNTHDIYQEESSFNHPYIYKNSVLMNSREYNQVATRQLCKNNNSLWTGDQLLTPERSPREDILQHHLGNDNSALTSPPRYNPGKTNGTTSSPYTSRTTIRMGENLVKEERISPEVYPENLIDERPIQHTFPDCNSSLRSPRSYNLVNINDTSVQTYRDDRTPWTASHNFVMVERNPREGRHGGLVDRGTFEHTFNAEHFSVMSPRVKINNTSQPYENNTTLWTGENSNETNSREVCHGGSFQKKQKFSENNTSLSSQLYNPVKHNASTPPPYTECTSNWSSTNFVKKERNHNLGGGCFQKKFSGENSSQMDPLVYNQETHNGGMEYPNRDFTTIWAPTNFVLEEKSYIDGGSFHNKSVGDNTSLVYNLVNHNDNDVHPNRDGTSLWAGDKLVTSERNSRNTLVNGGSFQHSVNIDNSSVTSPRACNQVQSNDIAGRLYKENTPLWNGVKEDFNSHDKSKLNTHKVLDAKNVTTPLHWCSVCNEVFNSAELLIEHLKMCMVSNGQSDDASLKLYGCAVCDETFEAVDTLRIHLKTHTEQNSYTCHICKMMFPYEATLVTHMELHSQYRCDVCENYFTGKNSLAVHKRTHTGARPYTCDICAKTFSRKDNLMLHMRTHTGARPHKCNLCEKNFSHKSSLILHYRSHTGDRPYKCDVCEKTFAQTNSLMFHKRTHTGDRPYKCDMCDKAFSRKHHMTSHMRMHTGDRPYKCDLCAKAFSHNKSLMLHKQIHTGDRPHSCALCQRKFFRKDNLMLHMRVHTGVRPYECDQCEKKFSHKKSLILHTQVHSGDRPYNCDLCGKTFSQKNSLMLHQRTHSGARPYKCDQCDKLFSRQHHVTVHMRIHTGDRPYKCDLCVKKFAYKKSLSLHKQIHTGYRPFKCDVCEKRFFQMGNLMSHQQVHTNVRAAARTEDVKPSITPDPEPV